MSVWTDGSFPLSLSHLPLPRPVVGQRCAGRGGLLAAGRWWGTSGMRGSRVAAVPLSCERWQAEGGEGEGEGEGRGRGGRDIVCVNEYFHKPTAPLQTNFCLHGV